MFFSNAFNPGLYFPVLFWLKWLFRNKSDWAILSLIAMSCIDKSLLFWLRLTPLTPKPFSWRKKSNTRTTEINLFTGIKYKYSCVQEVSLPGLPGRQALKFLKGKKSYSLGNIWIISSSCLPWNQTQISALRKKWPQKRTWIHQYCNQVWLKEQRKKNSRKPNETVNENKKQLAHGKAFCKWQKEYQCPLPVFAPWPSFFLHTLIPFHVSSAL